MSEYVNHEDICKIVSEFKEAMVEEYEEGLPNELKVGYMLGVLVRDIVNMPTIKLNEHGSDDAVECAKKLSHYCKRNGEDCSECPFDGMGVGESSCLLSDYMPEIRGDVLKEMENEQNE